jgi:c-di-AMP phosphodiesterase-like protein
VNTISFYDLFSLSHVIICSVSPSHSLVVITVVISLRNNIWYTIMPFFSRSHRYTYTVVHALLRVYFRLTIRTDQKKKKKERQIERTMYVHTSSSDGNSCTFSLLFLSVCVYSLKRTQKEYYNSYVRQAD